MWLEKQTPVRGKCDSISFAEMASAHHLNVYKYIKYLLDQCSNDQMEDVQLEKMMSWNENVIELCKIDN